MKIKSLFRVLPLLVFILLIMGCSNDGVVVDFSEPFIDADFVLIGPDSGRLRLTEQDIALIAIYNNVETEMTVTEMEFAIGGSVLDNGAPIGVSLIAEDGTKMTSIVTSEKLFKLQFDKKLPPLGYINTTLRINLANFGNSPAADAFYLTLETVNGQTVGARIEVTYE